MPFHIARNVSVGDGSSTGSTTSHPDRDIPQRDQADDADHRQEGVEPFHGLPLFTTDPITTLS